MYTVCVKNIYKKYELNDEQIAGMVLMSIILCRNNKFRNVLSQFKIFDPEHKLVIVNTYIDSTYYLGYSDKIIQLDGVDIIENMFKKNGNIIQPKNVNQPYEAILNNSEESILVQFKSDAFIWGCNYICNCLNINSNEYIYIIPQDTYIAKFVLKDKDTPTGVLSQKMIQCLNRNFLDGFGISINNISFLQPSTTYILSLDKHHVHIIASISISTNLSLLPYRYRRNNTFFIFNVCTYSPYQGKGYMKKLFTLVIQDVWTGQETHYYLQVESNNVKAIHLYERLGFKHIDTMYINNKICNLMHLSLSSTQM